MGVLALEDKVKVDRLICISQRKPLDHNTFVPRANDIRPGDKVLILGLAAGINISIHCMVW